TGDEYENTRDRVRKARNEGIFTPPALGDSISMPGKQGGSNWGTTAADPAKGFVFVVNVNEVAILRLEDVRTRSGRPATYGAQAYQKYCQACHGSDQPNAPPASAPSLTDVTSRLAEDTIRAAVTGGTGTMRPIQGISNTELAAVLAYLAAPPSREGGRGAPLSGPPPPPGPVVASGGVPLPRRQVPSELPPTYAGIGGTGGNFPYPGGVDVPPVRYVTEYGMMASATKPPYTTLTAYDLNNGTIKWQVPVGDDLMTLARGGPANTGGLGARNGMLVTKSGIVFIAGGDGKARAYDEDSGKVLWTGALPGNASGIPASYEAKARQYIVFSSQPRGGGRGGRGGTGEAGTGRGTPALPEAAPDAPRGYIAF